jgi:mannosyltransferase OCH1-like enzyme
MHSSGASERHQNNNVKVLHHYVNYLVKDIFFTFIKSCDSIISFLETKKKSKDEDPMENDLAMESLLSHN